LKSYKSPVALQIPKGSEILLSGNNELNNSTWNEEESPQ
jgi:hypothetical protein